MPVECSINAELAHWLRAMPSSSISLVLCCPATMCICITLVTASLTAMVLSGIVVIVHGGGMHDAEPILCSGCAFVYMYKGSALHKCLAFALHRMTCDLHQKCCIN